VTKIFYIIVYRYNQVLLVLVEVEIILVMKTKEESSYMLYSYFSCALLCLTYVGDNGKFLVVLIGFCIKSQMLGKLR
jgi:hypothetical protein